MPTVTVSVDNNLPTRTVACSPEALVGKSLGFETTLFTPRVVFVHANTVMLHEAWNFRLQSSQRRKDMPTSCRKTRQMETSTKKGNDALGAHASSAGSKASATVFPALHINIAIQSQEGIAGGMLLFTALFIRQGKLKNQEPGLRCRFQTDGLLLVAGSQNVRAVARDGSCDGQGLKDERVMDDALAF